MVIGSLATLDLPMIVDLIKIFELKGSYCTLTMTDWFLQALSVIPSRSWGDVARHFTMIRWGVQSSQEQLNSWRYKARRTTPRLENRAHTSLPQHSSRTHHRCHANSHGVANSSGENSCSSTSTQQHCTVTSSEYTTQLGEATNSACSTTSCFLLRPSLVTILLAPNMVHSEQFTLPPITSSRNILAHLEAGLPICYNTQEQHGLSNSFRPF
ncbi:hypothetical protein F511_20222 [Dorcoceras hygrometricum]|uniref:Uncharacterized protein n=1 Tax=Dorcoceras hygrometricum TaxID=472368 RepID=A0A2Z7AXY0_9LAMI|nr:hypothetical protein F511_20222 [Dorcoceras hygrometricum]